MAFGHYLAKLNPNWVSKWTPQNTDNKCSDRGLRLRSGFDLKQKA